MAGGMSDSPKLNCGRITLEIQTGDHGKYIVASDEEIQLPDGSVTGGQFVLSLGPLDRLRKFLNQEA